MASPAQCARSRLEFLKASHFRLGPDARLRDAPPLSTAHRHFRTPPPSARPALIVQPPRPQLFQVDERGAAGERASETHRAFTPPLEDAEEAGLRARARRGHARSPTPSWRLPAPRAPAALSTARASFGWPREAGRAPEQIRGARLIFDRDSVPAGDPAKLGLPPSTYRALFPAHWGAPLPRARCRHLGGSNPLQWDRENWNTETSYLRHFQALPGSPALTCRNVFSSVVLGDQNTGYESMCSEKKEMYTPQELPPKSYDKELSSAVMHHKSIFPGEHRFCDKTTTAQNFRAHQPEPLVLHHSTVPPSHILEGDQNMVHRDLISSHTFFYGPPPPNKPPGRHVPWHKLKSHVCFGEPTQLSQFFQTTMGTDYCPPGWQEPTIAPTLHLLESNLPTGTGEMYLLTTTGSMLKPHDTAPASMSHGLLQRCKYSHIEPPLGKQRFFNTGYQEDYPFRSLGTPELKTVRFQESHLPLGSPPPKGCEFSRRNPQVRQAPLYPCRSQQ